MNARKPIGPVSHKKLIIPSPQYPISYIPYNVAKYSIAHNKCSLFLRKEIAESWRESAGVKLFFSKLHQLSHHFKYQCLTLFAKCLQQSGKQFLLIPFRAILNETMCYMVEDKKLKLISLKRFSLKTEFNSSSWVWVKAIEKANWDQANICFRKYAEEKVAKLLTTIAYRSIHYFLLLLFSYKDALFSNQLVSHINWLLKPVESKVRSCTIYNQNLESFYFSSYNLSAPFSKNLHKKECQYWGILKMDVR